MKLYRGFQVIDALGFVLFVVLAAVLTPESIGLMICSAIGAYSLGHQTGTKKPIQRDARACSQEGER